MRKWLTMLTLGLVALWITKSQALVNIAGILEGRSVAVEIDSVVWYSNTSPIPITESTPGWSAQPNESDTFQFAEQTDWPYAARLFYKINNLPNQIYFNPLLPDTWYELSGYDLQPARVRFEDTFLLDLPAPEKMSGYQIPKIAPNPTKPGKVRIEPAINGVEVYDIVGKRCPVHLILDSRGLTIDISQLPCGSYLVRMKGNGLALSQRFLVVK